jgi:hypothetical protein
MCEAVLTCNLTNIWKINAYFWLLGNCSVLCHSFSGPVVYETERYIKRFNLLLVSLHAHPISWRSGLPRAIEQRLHLKWAVELPSLESSQADRLQPPSSFGLNKLIAAPNVISAVQSNDRVLLLRRDREIWYWSTQFDVCHDSTRPRYQGKTPLQDYPLQTP